MPVTVTCNSLERGKKDYEEQLNLADYSDSQTDMNKGTEDGSLSGGDGSSWQSVYKPTTVTLKYENHTGVRKYMQSLKYLLPVRVNTKPGTKMPVDKSGCCAFTFFCWLTPLVWRTFRKGLVQSDLYSGSPYDSCQVNGARLAKLWELQAKSHGLRNVSLLKTLFNFIRTRFFLSCFVYVICVAFGFIGPTIFMRFLLEYIQNPTTNHVTGLSWMLGLIICEFFRIICFALMWAINIRTAVRAVSAVMALLYQKITKLHSIMSSSAGELINLFANDCQKVYMMVYNAPLIIGGPLVVVGTIIYTSWLLGPFCFVGLGVFAISYAIQFGISYLIAYFRKRVIVSTDRRISLMTEFLSNVKIVKLYAWEQALIDSIREARLNERNFLEKCQYLQTLSASIASMASTVATVFTILAYTLSGYSLTPAEAFTLVMVNNVASHGIRTLPMCIRDIVNGTVALTRLQVLLHLEDHESYTTLPNSLEQAANFSKATLDWDQVMPNFHHKLNKGETGEVNLTITDNEKGAHDEITPETALVVPHIECSSPPALIDINFILPKGKLVGVCGTVGSGKSSLLAALLGQMRLLKGHVSVKGSIAYVSQQPWILNTTLRENILFGQLFSSKRYYEAVYCCGLTDDIASLPAGDQTEVGEKGVTLSGGQKQRISLARAQYSDKDLYLLDDPLSSVDSQVGRHIFQHCIKGALKDKSILFVTHQIKYLQECDSIILLRGGRIVEQGSHENLMNQESEYAAVVKMFSKNDNVKEDVETENTVTQDTQSLSPIKRRSISQSPSLGSSISDIDDSAICDGHLMTDEKLAIGSVSCETYMSYIYAAGGFIVCSLVLVWFILQAGSTEFSKYWLSYWLSQGDGNVTYKTIANIHDDGLKTNVSLSAPSITANPDVDFYQLIYGLSVLVMFTISIILGFLFTKTSLRASSVLHDRILLKVFHSPMHFFDTTPVGRILNIFTHDTDEIDNHLPFLIVSLLHSIVTVIFVSLLVVIVYHWFIIPFVVIAVLFILLQRAFRAIMRELKRYENVSRSPVFSHVGVTVQGLATIKAFQKQDEFYDRFSQFVDQHASPQYLYYCSMRWLGTRMDILCLLITIITACFVLFLKGDVDPSFAALALTLAMQLSGLYQYVVRLGCDVETRFTSVERIQSYVEELETEAPAIIEKNRPSLDWPPRGRICFLDVKMRYRPTLPLALKGLTFDIEPQEKICIVGRTGSGKSSVGAVLFRLVELSSGSIFIDGINIRDLGLEDLRSRMSIIPQEPVLFQGTVRSNLDPLSKFDDDELWEVLESTHVKEKIASMDGALDAVVVEGGDNFSVGEKQLICVARALLCHSKVLVLDEATASVDSETDNLIQKTIQHVFADSTVIVIAHRLTTVLNYDRVMVLSDGKIVEFDQPTILLAKSNSHFARLMSASKPTSTKL